jgi:hypothetical protein
MDNRRIILYLFFSGLLSATLAACEYEWRDEPPKLAINDQNVAPFSGGPQSSNVAVSEVPKKPAPTPVPADIRPTLAPGRDVSGSVKLPQDGVQIDILRLREEGKLTVNSNVPGVDVSLAFDERPDSLAKSEGVNPFRFDFELSVPIAIRAIRVLSSYSDYAWAFKTKEGERLVVDSVVDGDWSTIVLLESPPVKSFYVEVLRKNRDNFVHVNEIEIYR